jgi:hypothetical protein
LPMRSAKPRRRPPSRSTCASGNASFDDGCEPVARQHERLAPARDVGTASPRTP